MHSTGQHNTAQDSTTQLEEYRRWGGACARVHRYEMKYLLFVVTEVNGQSKALRQKNQERDKPTETQIQPYRDK